MAGKYRAYSEYKDSGVEWLDQVPGHWSSVPLKYMALESGSLFLDGNWIESKDLSEDGIRYITTGNVGEGVYREQGLGFITEDKFQELDCTEVFEGDILISRLNAPIGRSCVVPDLESKVVTSVDNVIFRPDRKYSKKYIVHLFTCEAYFKHTANLARGATMQRISRGLLGNIRVVIPSLGEQEKIANFLDHETAKIDTLIEKQQQLIKLLQEKRQAVISHAVTKGLNPNVPMRDSGVEWLGEVPEHWEVKKFSWCTSIRSGQVDPTALPFSEYILIAPNHIESETGRLLYTETAAEQGADSGKYLCEKGEVIYSKIRPALAKVCISPSDETICSADMYPIQGVNGLTNQFLFWTLLSRWFTSFVILESDRVAMPKINREKLAEVLLPLPPVAEQLRISQQIEEKLAVIDTLLGNAWESIGLAQERRTALISAAVTGKIDVRDWVKPEQRQMSKGVAA